MEFLSPQTRERIERLEQKLKKAQQALDKAEQKRGTPARHWFVVVALVFFSAVAGWVLKPEASAEEMAQIRVQLWADGTAQDTALNPQDSLRYSVQIGAYKELNLSELSMNLEELHVDQLDGVERISLGSFASLPEAQAFLEVSVRLGFENAYIVAYSDGNAVGLLAE